MNRMRNSVVRLGLAACTFLICISASAAISEADLLALEKRRYAAMENVDTVELDKMLAEELIFTHASGKIDSRETFLANLTSGNLVYKSITTDDLKARMYGESAVVTGKSMLDISVRGEDRRLVLRFTSVWICDKDGWQLVAYQSTKISQGI